MQDSRRLALIDGDLLVHEISVLGEYYEEDDVEKEHLKIRDFRYLEEIAVNRIEEICEAANCYCTPLIYLSGSNNFRYDVAKEKPYKGNRDKDKPIHFENVKWFLISRYDAQVVEGIEADDALAIFQTEFNKKGHTTVICTRDKDLRQVPGWHYGWEVGNQPEYALSFVDELGTLEATWKEGFSEKTGKPTRSFKKISGTGYKWFCAQILVGDTTDNIPGLKGCGGKKAYDSLEGCTSEEEALSIVKGLYEEAYGDQYEQKLTEQAQLVWMVRELDEDGKPVMWRLT
jgi:hypothetical protein